MKEVPGNKIGLRTILEHCVNNLSKFQAQIVSLNNLFGRLGDLKNESHYLKKKPPFGCEIVIFKWEHCATKQVATAFGVLDSRQTLVVNL